MPKWARNFVSPPVGRELIYADWVSQEVMIAGGVSEDDALIRAYTGAPNIYIGVGQQLGLIPAGATKRSHPDERNRCKPLVLGLLYLMSPYGISARLNVSLREGRRIHRQLRRTFPRYYEWAESVVRWSRFGNPLETALGWTLRARPTADNSRTRGNFMIQAIGGEILRAACLLADEASLEIIGTVHDSLLIQCPAGSLPEVSEKFGRIMEQAAEMIIEYPILVDSRCVGPGQRLLDPETDSKAIE